MRLLWVVIATVAVPMSVAAQSTTASSSNRMAIFESQTQLMDGRLSKQYSNSVRLQPQSFGASAVAIPRYTGSIQ